MQSILFQNNDGPAVPLPKSEEGGSATSGNDQNENEDRPTIPLPNFGEGGPVDSENNQENRPVVPLPDPGEGARVSPGPGMPVFPGTGGSGNINIPGIIGTIITTFPKPNAPCRFCTGNNQSVGNVRFLNAASNYNPFSVYVNNQLFVDSLGLSEVTAYERVLSGYQIITVMGDNQYVFIQKPVMVPRDGSVTVAICNTESGLDLFVIVDSSCNRSNFASCMRVCNLSYNSGPLSVVMGNNVIRFTNVTQQEVTNFRIIMPGDYVFYVMNMNRNVLLSSTMNIKAVVSYTMYLFNWSISSPDAITALIVEER